MMLCNIVPLVSATWMLFNTFCFIQGQQLYYIIPYNLKGDSYSQQHENKMTQYSIEGVNKLLKNKKQKIKPLQDSSTAYFHDNYKSNYIQSFKGDSYANQYYKLSDSIERVKESKSNENFLSKNMAQSKRNNLNNGISIKMKALEKVLDNSQEKAKNIESLISRDTETISSLDITEEKKRIARQVRRQRPGFFWTLARIVFETFNDTRSAVEQISQLINGSIAPEVIKSRKSSTSNFLLENSTIAEKTITDQNVTDQVTTTTTEAPLKLTRSGYLQLINRNLRGLVRLFNIEWRDAWNQSQITTREFQRTLGKQVRSYLQDNPEFY